MPVLRQHHLRRFMVESVDHLVDLVAYTLELPKELSNVHSTFHVSNLKKCLSDESLVIPMKELRLDDKLNFMEEPVEIRDREVEKALYGLHQVPIAWYETLSTYLIENGFRRGTIDKTLFVKKDKGLQVQQKENGIFISQDKYVAEILKKFDFATVKTASIPMEPNKALVKDKEADSMDAHLYKSMIRSLMYLTTSRPDICLMVFACAKVIKIHTDHNVVDPLTKAFDVSRFNFLVASIGLELKGKFDGKANEGFFVGFSVVSKAMRVFNNRTMIVEGTLNIRFLKNAPNVTRNGPDWLFDVDSLTISMNYVPVVARNQTNGIAETRDNIVIGQAEKKTKPEQEYILIPICTTDPLISQGPKESEKDVGIKPTEVNVSRASDKDREDDQATRSDTARPFFINDAPSSPVNAARTSEEHLFEQFSPFKNAFALPHVPNVFSIDDTRIFGNAYNDEDVGAEADLNNLETTMNVSPITTKNLQGSSKGGGGNPPPDHPKDQIIGDLNLAIQTRRMTKISDEHAMKVWTLVNLPNDKRAIRTKWVFRNKKDERGIVIRNKARLVVQGYTQEEGIDYDEVFSPIARIEAIRLFLAYASFMEFIVYQMDVKSAFLYGTIKKEVYVCQPPGFEDPQFPDKVYKVEKALYCLHQAPRAWYETLSTYLIENGFRRCTIDKTLFIMKDKGDILLVHVYVDDIIFGSTKKSLCDEFEGLMHKIFQMRSIRDLTFFLGLQVQQMEDGIFISQDKYVAIILKFDFATMKSAITPMEPNKALVKDEETNSMDAHLYRSMIGSLMYLTASRLDITFAVCAYARFQVTPKTSHLHAVKRIFRYLKGQPKLGLWYPRDSPFDLEAFSDSDYVGASLDKKSTIGGCQFLGKRLISWQCKKQTIVANSTIEAEYVAAANCCRQVLWIQNQMLDYGFNFMNTKIYIDNESTICIVKNPVFHSKTKHIEIRHHFIRDSYEKRLIQGRLMVYKCSGLYTSAIWIEVGRIDAQTRFETSSKQSNDPPLSRGYTLGSGEDSMKLL
ncbi:putative ribonuclease H-like domain-containing protein [Tanacetum coccineum]